MMLDNTDNYKVLDLSRNATAEEVRLAYKKLALKWHPDRHTTDKEAAQQKFIEIHEAYRVLTEKKDRQRSKQSEDDSKSSGSSSPCSASNSPTPPSSPKPSTHSSSCFQSHSQDSSSSSDCHGWESHTTPPSSPQPSTHSSGSRSHSHGSPSPSNPHDPGPHETPISSPRTPHSSGHPQHKSSCDHASDPRTSPPESHLGQGPSHRRPPNPASYEAPPSSAPAPHSPASSESRTSSSWIGTDSSSDSHTQPPSSHSETHSKSKSFHPHYQRQPEPPSTPKSTRSKLHKQSKPALHRPDHTPTKHPPKRRTAHSVPVSPISGAYPRDAGNSKEWRCPMKLTLEELFHGKHLRFRLTRYMLSNKKKHVILDIHVPSGCRPGTKIICPGIGHERKDGSLQDIIFVIEEAPHERFSRLQKNGDDLSMEVKLPWVKALEKERGEVHFKGIDGKNMAVKIDYPNDRHMEGTHVVVGAGMPIRGGGEGKVARRRGDLVVRWEIVTSPTSAWEALKHRVLHFKASSFKD